MLEAIKITRAFRELERIRRLLYNELPKEIQRKPSLLANNTSYPIEIAWNDPTGKVTKKLIKPADGWRSWDFAAERIHGISKEEIEKNGVLVDFNFANYTYY